jgi:hypothetical protein
MHGEGRIPTLIKYVGRLCKEAALLQKITADKIVSNPALLLPEKIV